MNERMHQYLDGEIRREELTTEELRKIQTFEAIISETRESYRCVEVPDLTGPVMARLSANDRPSRLSAAAALRNGLQRAAGWLWAPRLVQVRAVYGLLAATLFLVSVISYEVWTPDGMNEPSVANVDVASSAGKVFVQFRLDAPAESQVRLAGSFTGWQPVYALKQVSSGTWSILIPLEPGVYEYAFVVNGTEWRPDPAAPAVDDGFGGVNSRLSVLLPGSSKL